MHAYMDIEYGRVAEWLGRSISDQGSNITVDLYVLMLSVMGVGF